MARRGIPSSPFENWNDDTTGRGTPLLVMLETPPKSCLPTDSDLIIRDAVAGVGGDVAVWITRVGCACGWCWTWWTSCVRRRDATVVYKVALSGTGRHHDDVAGNDLQEIQIVR